VKIVSSNLLISTTYGTTQGKPKYNKNTPEDDLNTFCNVTNQIRLKYHYDFYGTLTN